MRCSLLPLWLLAGGGPGVALAGPPVGDAAEPSKNCERLATSLTYTQEKAPRDISGVLPVVVEKVNRELEGVVDVEVEWTGGELHRRVGEHVVQCSVTRLLSAVKKEKVISEDIVGTDEHGRRIIVQCFHVPFRILDTDECNLPVGHAMRHRCHGSAICVNTVGSYECLCPLPPSPGQPGQPTSPPIPTTTENLTVFWSQISSQKRSPWSVSYDSKSESSCPSRPTTHGCCPPHAHTPDGSTCRSAFRCPVDPCSSSKHHDCATNARCQRTVNPSRKPNYDCKCPRGLMGNGHACTKGDVKPQPKVMYDGVTPTEETVRHGFYCGCTKPVVDACAGFPPCEGKHEICTVTATNTPQCDCEPGYVNNHDGYGCIDETPPILRLRHDPAGDGITRLKQGDVYKEHAVDIIDDNAEDYLRSLKITYSQPLPPGCLIQMGSFHVNYTVATPWTSPPYVRVTRKVIIEDIDECTLDVAKYETSCPELIPKCDIDAGAKCVNTVGSYTCQCPQYTSGDGFLSISTLSKDDMTGTYGDLAPEGYDGGTGCRDTSKPVIELLGPSPKVFKVCKCGGLSGIMGAGGGGGGKAGSEGAMKGLGYEEGGESLLRDQRKRYEGDIKDMIQSTAGAELCATHTLPSPQPSNCVRATDHTYKGSVDLTSRVVVGEPVSKSKGNGNVLQWSVPYDVVDDAGNTATTVWRDVMVEEVDLYDLESRIRAEVLAEREGEVKDAVRVALEEERAKREQLEVVPVGRKDKRKKLTECPPCPECVCPEDGSGGEFDASKCDPICDIRISNMENTCFSDNGGDAAAPPAAATTTPPDRITGGAAPIPKDSVVASPFLVTLHWLESVFPPSLILVVFFCSTGFVFFLVTRRVLGALFNRDESYYNWADVERERAMMNSVTYYSSPEPPTANGGGVGFGGSAGTAGVTFSNGGMAGGGGTTSGGAPGSAPPRASMSVGGGAAVGNGIFSPQENRMYGGQHQQQHSPSHFSTNTENAGRTPHPSRSRRELEQDDDSIYNMSPITPSRSNGTPASVDSQRTPYNLRRRY